MSDETAQALIEQIEAQVQDERTPLAKVDRLLEGTVAVCDVTIKGLNSSEFFLSPVKLWVEQSCLSSSLAEFDDDIYEHLQKRHDLNPHNIRLTQDYRLEVPRTLPRGVVDQLQSVWNNWTEHFPASPPSDKDNDVISLPAQHAIKSALSDAYDNLSALLDSSEDIYTLCKTRVRDRDGKGSADRIKQAVRQNGARHWAVKYWLGYQFGDLRRVEILEAGTLTDIELINIELPFGHTAEPQVAVRSQTHTNVETRISTLIRRSAFRESFSSGPIAEKQTLTQLERKVWGEDDGSRPHLFVIPIVAYRPNGFTTLGAWYVKVKDADLGRLLRKGYSGTQAIAQTLDGNYYHYLAESLARELFSESSNLDMVNEEWLMLSKAFGRQLELGCRGCSDQSRSLWAFLERTLFKVNLRALRDDWDENVKDSLRNLEAYSENNLAIVELAQKLISHLNRQAGIWHASKNREWAKVRDSLKEIGEAAGRISYHRGEIMRTLAIRRRYNPHELRPLMEYFTTPWPHDYDQNTSRADEALGHLLARLTSISVSESDLDTVVNAIKDENRNGEFVHIAQLAALFESEPLQSLEKRAAFYFLKHAIYTQFTKSTAKPILAHICLMVGHYADCRYRLEGFDQEFLTDGRGLFGKVYLNTKGDNWETEYIDWLNFLMEICWSKQEWSPKGECVITQVDKTSVTFRFPWPGGKEGLERLRNNAKAGQSGKDLALYAAKLFNTPDKFRTEHGTFNLCGNYEAAIEWTGITTGRA